MVIVVLRPYVEGEFRSNPVLPHDDELDVEMVEAEPSDGALLLEETGASGLYILGSGETRDGLRSSSNGARDCKVSFPWTQGHREILGRCLELDMPVLAIGGGLFLLNQVFGGKAPETTVPILPKPGLEAKEQRRRTIYVSPGSKTAAILGAGGFFRLNGAAPSPSLLDSHRAPRLLASAYAVDSGAVEGLESAEHDWVLGFRADLSAEEKLPRGFSGIFQAFVERTQEFQLARAAP